MIFTAFDLHLILWTGSHHNACCHDSKAGNFASLLCNLSLTLAIMDGSYSDAQMLWPVSGQPLNCSGILGTPIVANTTGTRVCGVQTNRTIAERCCGSATIQEYQCWLYCETTDSMSDWTRCANEGIENGYGWGPFCQGDLMSNNTETLNSSAFRSSMPRYSWIISALLFAFVFIGPAQAAIVHSLRDLEDTATDILVKRQNGNDGCSVDVDQTYSSLVHGSKKVSDNYDCTNSGGNFCTFDLQVQTPLSENNRTFNGSSAAETMYDGFFDVLSNATEGRKFPAMSSTNLTRGVAVSTGQMFFLGWTPISVGYMQTCFVGFLLTCRTVLCQWHYNGLQRYAGRSRRRVIL